MNGSPMSANPKNDSTGMRCCVRNATRCFARTKTETRSIAMSSIENCERRSTNLIENCVNSTARTANCCGNSRNGKRTSPNAKNYSTVNYSTASYRHANCDLFRRRRTNEMNLIARIWQSCCYPTDC